MMMMIAHTNNNNAHFSSGNFELSAQQQNQLVGVQAMILAIGWGPFDLV